MKKMILKDDGRVCQKILTNLNDINIVLVLVFIVHKVYCCQILVLFGGYYRCLGVNVVFILNIGIIKFLKLNYYSYVFIFKSIFSFYM